MLFRKIANIDMTEAIGVEMVWERPRMLINAVLNYSVRSSAEIALPREHLEMILLPLFVEMVWALRRKLSR